MLGPEPGHGLAIRELPGGTRPAPREGLLTPPAETSRASKVLSTIVVTVTSSTSGNVTGSTASPSAARGAAQAVSTAECS